MWKPYTVDIADEASNHISCALMKKQEQKEWKKEAESVNAGGKKNLLTNLLIHSVQSWWKGLHVSGLGQPHADSKCVAWPHFWDRLYLMCYSFLLRKAGEEFWQAGGVYLLNHLRLFVFQFHYLNKGRERIRQYFVDETTKFKLMVRLSATPLLSNVCQMARFQDKGRS